MHRGMKTTIDYSKPLTDLQSSMFTVIALNCHLNSVRINFGSCDLFQSYEMQMEYCEGIVCTPPLFLLGGG